MNTWTIVLIIASTIIILYLIFKRSTLPAAAATVATPIESAPGVSAATGQVYSNPVSPPPESTTGITGTVSTFQKAANPATVLQHIPVVGKTVASVSTAVSKAPTAIANKVNSSISHIPVVGKALAAPGKVATKVLSKLNPFSW